MPMARVWNGMSIQDQVQRANGRAIVGIGVAVATETKRLTHRISGTLARSVHAAPPHYEALEDVEQAQAEISDLLFSHLPSVEATYNGPSSRAVEVGSWMPYACVEWVGRMHPGVTQGLEAVRGRRADEILIQAFREEGL